MTLRTRLAGLTAAAVAFAVLGASVTAWFLIRATLMDDIDRRLLERVPDLERLADTALATQAPAPDTDGNSRSPALLLQGDPVGVQKFTATGTVVGTVPPGDEFDEMLGEAERELLADDAGDPLLYTAVRDGAPFRVMSAALGDDFVIRLIQPLDGVERTMARMAWLLVGVAGAGVVIAGGIGWLTARAALRPVDALTRAAEQVAATKDLAHRIDSGGARRRDEVSRLAASVNTMLAALDDARTEQRHLVEDAGHELRTPLATLRNDIGVLIRAERHPERVLNSTDRAGLLRDLESEASALTDLITELVELARGEAEPEPLIETDLRVLVDRAAERARRIDPRVPVTVTGTCFPVTARPAIVERALGNLVRNAVQVSNGVGAVEVELTDDGDAAMVRVLDRGPGLEPQEIPRLFDRFFRGEDARGRHGSGLGLAIVAQAADQHQGGVEAANRPGGGAVFTLRLPALSADS